MAEITRGPLEPVKKINKKSKRHKIKNKIENFLKRINKYNERNKDVANTNAKEFKFPNSEPKRSKSRDRMESKLLTNINKAKILEEIMKIKMKNKWHLKFLMIW